MSQFIAPFVTYVIIWLLLIITSVITSLLLIITKSLLPIIMVIMGQLLPIITWSIIGNNGSIITYYRPGQLGGVEGCECKNQWQSSCSHLKTAFADLIGKHKCRVFLSMQQSLLAATGSRLTLWRDAATLASPTKFKGFNCKLLVVTTICLSHENDFSSC